MIERTSPPWTRKSPLGAKVCFPDLTAQEALLVADLLERILSAIWRAHGDAMADYLAGTDPDAALSAEPDDLPAITSKAPRNEDDIF